MAILRVPDEAERIQLNRAGGESYDQGTQMTMAEAIKIAEQYGHVPARISSGAMPDDTTGIWAIPTAQGWVPLDRLTAQESWSRNGGSAQPQVQQQQTYMPSISNQSKATQPAQGIVSQIGSPSAPSRPPAMGQPQPYERGLGWLNRTGTPQTPSTSGPVVGGGSPPQFQTPVQGYASVPQQPVQQPVINVNIGGGPSGVPGGQYTGAGSQYDPSGWNTPSNQFNTGWREESLRRQIYEGVQPRQVSPGVGQPYESKMGALDNHAARDYGSWPYAYPQRQVSPGGMQPYEGGFAPQENLSGMQASPPIQYSDPMAGGSTIGVGSQSPVYQEGQPQPYEQGLPMRDNRMAREYGSWPYARPPRQAIPGGPQPYESGLGMFNGPTTWFDPKSTYQSYAGLAGNIGMGGQSPSYPVADALRRPYEYSPVQLPRDLYLPVLP